jgi:hypothetical protein
LGIARQKKMLGGETRFTPLSETLFNMGRAKNRCAGYFPTRFDPASSVLKTETPADPEDRDRRFFAPLHTKTGQYRGVLKQRGNSCYLGAASPTAYRSASALIECTAGCSSMLSR